MNHCSLLCARKYVGQGVLHPGWWQTIHHQIGISGNLLCAYFLMGVVKKISLRRRNKKWLNNWSCFLKKEGKLREMLGWMVDLEFSQWTKGWIKSILEFKVTECNESPQGHSLGGSRLYMRCLTDTAHQPHVEGISVLILEEKANLKVRRWTIIQIQIYWTSHYTKLPWHTRKNMSYFCCFVDFYQKT